MKQDEMLRRATRDALLYNEEYIEACKHCKDMDLSKTRELVQAIKRFRRSRGW